MQHSVNIRPTRISMCILLVQSQLYCGKFSSSYTSLGQVYHGNLVSQQAYNWLSFLIIPVFSRFSVLIIPVFKKYQRFIREQGWSDQKVNNILSDAC